MKELHIDLETFSSTDLGKCGLYKYSESPDFEITLFGYSVDGGEVHVVDLMKGEKIPEEIINAIKDESVIKTAHNAMFERVCLSRFLGFPPHTYLNPHSWHCTLIWSAYLGLPLALKDVGYVLKLDRQKLEEGKELVKYFCVPCSPTKANNYRTRNMPDDAPEKWELFKAYNKRDVETEMEIQQRLEKYPVPDEVWEEYWLDQEINDRGVRVDLTLVDKAITMDEASKTELTKKAQEITNLENPNSAIQLKHYLSTIGVDVESLGKKQVKEMLKEASPEVKEILELRLQLAKSSVKKYQAMKNASCSDDRARGMFQFYGANRTGRFSGRLIQLQNLPQNHLPDLAEARSLVRDGDYEVVKLLYEDVPDTLSQLVRTAFIPSECKKYIVADFSAIEARVIAWFANEKWRLNAFKNGEDIYCASASQMFHVPVVKHGVNGELRQKGKIAELALGYGGSVGAMKAMGALDMGLDEEELEDIVTMWRGASPNITKFWWDVDSAAMKAVKEKTTVKLHHGITFTYKSGLLFITLPSGRKLSYVKPRIGINQFGGECITYEGVGSTKKWERIDTYGPKLVENIVQATARDILCFAMKNLSNQKIVMTVHDEIIVEAEKETTVKEISDIMGQTPPWAEGLLLRADGYECEFYKKD
ncbi:MAG TPA: DNA polymerase [Treponemataceae bacterium]|nr:DNA polymerase [Treponemataceae bacterium]